MIIQVEVFKEDQKITPTDLSKQHILDADPRATKQINFTGNLKKAHKTTMSFILKEAIVTILDFSNKTMNIS